MFCSEFYELLEIPPPLCTTPTHKTAVLTFRNYLSFFVGLKRFLQIKYLQRGQFLYCGRNQLVRTRTVAKIKFTFTSYLQNTDVIRRFFFI